MITAVICDLDGLLADTEKYHMKAYQETFAAEGVIVSDEDYITHWIRNCSTIGEFIAQRKLGFDPDLMRSKKTVRYHSYVESHVEEMPGAVSFLQRIHGHKRLALASNSLRQDIDRVLGKIGADGFFEVLLSKLDVAEPKPAPDMFIKTADRLNEPVTRCVVVEDSCGGVEAAHRAGMKCIAVPSRYTVDNDFSRASIVVDRLDDVTVELLDSLK